MVLLRIFLLIVQSPASYEASETYCNIETSKTLSLKINRIKLYARSTLHCLLVSRFYDKPYNYSPHSLSPTCESLSYLHMHRERHFWVYSDSDRLKGSPRGPPTSAAHLFDFSISHFRTFQESPDTSRPDSDSKSTSRDPETHSRPSRS